MVEYFGSTKKTSFYMEGITMPSPLGNEYLLSVVSDNKLDTLIIPASHIYMSISECVYRLFCYLHIGVGVWEAVSKVNRVVIVFKLNRPCQRVVAPFNFP